LQPCRCWYLVSLWSLRFLKVQAFPCVPADASVSTFAHVPALASIPSVFDVPSFADILAVTCNLAVAGILLFLSKFLLLLASLWSLALSSVSTYACIPAIAGFPFVFDVPAVAVNPYYC
jgi:hypothetical protein